MKKSIVAIAATLLAIYWSADRPKTTAKTAEAKVIAIKAKPTAASAKINSARQPAAVIPVANSLTEMTSTLARFAKPRADLRDLLDTIQDQQPVITHDSNSVTGEMAIVRTKKPLPGTRYFHAQFFNNEDGQPFVQHMSFEFKPGPTAMADAVQAVHSAFGVQSPETQREGYAKWDLPDGHILWVKKMDRDDLKDDPFNAYSDSDVGTVRVVLEAEIH